MHKILILDFGSQYTQLIARRIRELGVYCEIHSCDMSDEEIKAYNPVGVVLSGGPESVHLEGTPRIPEILFSLNCPLLGICYGMQAMAHQLGGQVAQGHKREYGHAQLTIEKSALPSPCETTMGKTISSKSCINMDAD